MTHKQAKINGFEVHYFDEFKEAQTWMRDLQGPKAQFISYISRQDVFNWAVKIDKAFGGKQYLPKDLLKVLDERDVDELTTIHPEYFLYWKGNLTKEQRLFLAENLTLKQIQNLPKPFVNKFDTDDLEIMLKKVPDTSSHYYRVYTLRKQNRADNSIFVRIKLQPVGAFLRGRIDYLNTNKVESLAEDIEVDLTKDTLSVKEVAKYLDINIQYFKQMEKIHKDGMLYKMLSPGMEKSGKEVFFKTSDLKKFMKAVYVTKTGEPCEDESLYFPKEGVFTSQDIVERCGARNVTHRTMKHARYSSTISYFAVADRYPRFSERDFEEFIEARAYDEINIRSNMVEKVIQFPKNATEAQIKNVLSQYITVEELSRIIPFTGENLENIPPNLCTSSFMKLLMSIDDKYKNRVDDKKYFKRETVVKVLSERYGYYGKYVQGQNPIAFPYPLDFNELYAYMKEGDRDRGGLYPITMLIDRLSKKYVDFPEKTFRTSLNEWILSGKVPVLFLTKRLRQVYLPHLEECEKYQNFIKRHNVKLAE